MQSNVHRFSMLLSLQRHVWRIQVYTSLSIIEVWVYTSNTCTSSCLYLAIGPASDEFHDSISIEVKSMDAHGVVFRLRRKEKMFIWHQNEPQNSFVVLRNNFFAIFVYDYKKWCDPQGMLNNIQWLALITHPITVHLQALQYFTTDTHNPINKYFWYDKQNITGYLGKYCTFPC